MTQKIKLMLVEHNSKITFSVKYIFKAVSTWIDQLYLLSRTFYSTSAPHYGHGNPFLVGFVYKSQSVKQKFAHPWCLGLVGLQYGMEEDNAWNPISHFQRHQNDHRMINSRLIFVFERCKLFKKFGTLVQIALNSPSVLPLLGT